jgi:signal transduction histidine kinase
VIFCEGFFGEVSSGAVSAPSADLVERLKQHALLRDLPHEQVVWVAAHGRPQRLAAGEALYPQGSKIDSLYLVLSGHLSIHIDRGAGRRKAMEWRGGEVTGLMPYSRLSKTLGAVVAEAPTELVSVSRDHFPEMIRDCHELAAVFVHVMLDRARAFTSGDLHDEKLMSLGKLAAGLAHELNNPASAIVRSAKGFTEYLTGAERASRALGAAGLSAEQLAAVDAVRTICLGTPVTSVHSPLQRADHEDAVVAWLEDHGADVSSAGPLAETAVTLETLDRLAATLEGPALEAALAWVAADCATRRIAVDIELAASRIHDLVAAVKGFTRMDHATVPEAVDVGRGLIDTLAVLQAKARAKSVAVNVTVEPDLPRVQGYGGELNQVWLNLIDNALDAVATGGRVEVRAAPSDGAVMVRVIDDGPGIPDDIRGRIFDPFFTTKQVGDGTGLGLDIVRRLVQRHDGTIEVDSRPARTEFRVRLPVTS